jgi:ATP-dependent helicase/DNAse subunit B
MNCAVFTGTDPAANLQELLRHIPLGSGSLCAVVPDFRSTLAIEREILNHRGMSSLRHKIYTIEGISREILSHTGVAPEIIGNHVKRALLAEIVKSRIKGHSRYYTVARYPGFIRLLITFLEEIRSSTGKILTKDPELISIANAYESHLNRLRLTDHEGIVSMALESGMSGYFAELFDGPLIVDGFYDFTDKQLELITILIQKSGRSAVTCVYDKSRPELFRLPGRLLSELIALGAKIVEVPSVMQSGPDYILSGFRGGTYDGLWNAGEVEMHMFRSESSEADWVAGTIRSLIVNKIYRPENIMIVSRNGYSFSSPMAAMFKKHGIPVEGDIVRPLASHPLVQTVLDALDASIDPQEDIIVSVQKSGYTGQMNSRSSSLTEIMDDRAWSCMIAENDSPEGFVSSMKRMLEWLNIKVNLDGGGLGSLAIFETVVYDRFMCLLDEFAAFYSGFIPMMKAREFSGLLKLFIQDITLPDRVSPARGVCVLDANHARFVRRDVVFFTGLDNTSFPAQYKTHSLFDSETAFMLRNHKELEEGLLFYMTILGAKKLFFTFPGIDDEGKDSSISPFLREIKENLGDRLNPVFHHGVPGAACMEGFVDEQGRLETIVRVLRDSDDESSGIWSSLNRRNGEIVKTVEASVRAYIQLSEMKDMNLNHPHSKSIIGDEWGKKPILPVTDLELYCSCPIKFFLTRILKLQTQRLTADGLEPSEKGSIVHEILAHFFRRLQTEYGTTIILDKNTLNLTG